MPFHPGAEEETRFRRADLIFDGVGHTGMSYDVRIFLNNPQADADTPADPNAGYAGKFSVFGHGDCFGEPGHCSTAGAPTARDAVSMAYARPHPMAGHERIVTITEGLNAVLRGSDTGLETITLVPIARMPRRADSGPRKGLLSYDRVKLRTYR
jgi:hypothetical protein